MVDGNIRGAALKLLRNSLSDNNAEFRNGQWEAIDALVNKRRKLLVVQKTGWGKSAVYFIATRLFREMGSGPTIIVSPLLALMRNQILAAERIGIKAMSINSTNEEEWDSIIEAVLRNKADVVLISPERLANDAFVNDVLMPIAERIGLLVIDEAHCISDWGHDFRPDYRRIVSILQQLPPNVPVLATTATANDRVIEDVCAQLGNIECSRGILARDSLALQVLRLPHQAARLAWLAQHIHELPGTGIIYVLTKRDAEQVAQWLQRNKINALAYHADIVNNQYNSSDEYRRHLEDLLLNSNIKALVATTALSMGYDKPDLGFVVHYQSPGSIVAYYQQVGRAGRAIQFAVGILMSGAEDEEIHEYFRDSAFPDELQVNELLNALSKSDGMTRYEIGNVINLTYGQIEKVLKYLSVENPSPVIRIEKKWFRTPVEYSLDIDRIQRLTKKKIEEWQEIQSYIETDSCLMVFLARALNDSETKSCGKCKNCTRKDIIDTSISVDLTISAIDFLGQLDIPLKCKLQVPSGAFDVYELSGNLPKILRAQEGRILSRWGDAAWGHFVAVDKHNGYFRDELVDACIDLIQKRWKPDPRPEWVTCVPSHRHLDLVPSFAKRLAKKLDIPFIDAVSKTRENKPQKLQQNRFHQCKNLDGVFDVVQNIPNSPVLLVDDIIDSGWTLTTVAALLLRSGSGFVYPIALASTTSSD